MKLYDKLISVFLIFIVYTTLLTEFDDNRVISLSIFSFYLITLIITKVIRPKLVKEKDKYKYIYLFNSFISILSILFLLVILIVTEIENHYVFMTLILSLGIISNSQKVENEKDKT